MKASSLKSRVTRTLMMGLCLMAAPAVQASGVKVLEPRLSTVKPTSPELDPETPVQRLVVKFHEGTRVRQRGSGMRVMALERSLDERARMRRHSLFDSKLRADLQIALMLLDSLPRMGPPERLFRQDEFTLAERKSLAEDRSGKEMADLDLYFEVPLQPGTLARDVNPVVMQLNALDSVEIAYAEAATEPAVFSLGESDGASASTTYESLQGYLDMAPGGIDARYAWTVPGGTGAGVKIVDVEGAWNGSHEDLPPFFYEGGIQFIDSVWRNHGTAVMGVMAGKANGYGITGIAHGAQVGREGIANQSIASAITRAALAAGRGGVVLVQLQAVGPRTNKSCACNASQCNEIPLEFWQANFDAIAQATAAGVHVVEAAGNGSVNLDAPEYRGAFDLSVRDSGAILVGAGTATTRAPMCWANHGSRVDVQGWGEKVVTLGYGDLSAAGENRWYTASFSGSSSAAPMVVGAVADLQGVANAAGKGPIDPRALRELLRATGTPQASSTKQIGPLPDLRSAIPQVLAR
ncbi:S8 family peptidase [Vitiosangium sp. GDMCC 1.1324]|uniref:S8 family peptidase n=1 Tax=Vitiosangium sp. (strain GDMCC 1.1324) TaxID=2138576 RepID=UPI000D333761|nr:S8 family peptidase [Vitiosangium sp. GDMCC 1.1324]PTL83360.1 peptidase S8 [Vitiosangium sp. GDMCC 1.1324]